MSAKYGTPAFPIRGNIFYGNSGLTLILNLEWNNAYVSFTGFALVCLILFTLFIIAWEKVLQQFVDRGVQYISTAVSENNQWIKIQQAAERVPW